jgi:hypothetical protein
VPLHPPRKGLLPGDPHGHTAERTVAIAHGIPYTDNNPAWMAHPRAHDLISEVSAPRGFAGVHQLELAGQQTGSKRPKSASLNHAESGRENCEKPHE